MAAAICAGVLVSLLFLSYIMSSGLLHRRDTGITLPTGEADTPVVTADSQLLTAQSVADVDITTDNVQHVIASLTRPEAYSCTIENKLYYTGGSSSLRCRRYVRDGVIRTDTLTDSGAVRSSIIRRGDTIYSWNADSSAVYEGRAGSFSDDASAMLPTMRMCSQQALHRFLPAAHPQTANRASSSALIWTATAALTACLRPQDFSKAHRSIRAIRSPARSLSPDFRPKPPTRYILPCPEGKHC